MGYPKVLFLDEIENSYSYTHLGCLGIIRFPFLSLTFSSTSASFIIYCIFYFNLLSQFQLQIIYVAQRATRQLAGPALCHTVGLWVSQGGSAPHVFILMPTLRGQKLCKESCPHGSGMRFVFTNTISQIFVHVYLKCFISTHLYLLIYQGIFFEHEFPSWGSELFLLYKPYL